MKDTCNALNARGEKLLEFDKLRDNLFLRAHTSRDDLYEKYWERFEDDYWDPDIQKIGTDYEDFCHRFLIANLGTEDVKPEFITYEQADIWMKRKLKDETIEDKFILLKAYSDVYREMTDCDENTLIGKRAWNCSKIFDLIHLEAILVV